MLAGVVLGVAAPVAHEVTLPPHLLQTAGSPVWPNIFRAYIVWCILKIEKITDFSLTVTIV